MSLKKRVTIAAAEELCARTDTHTHTHTAPSDSVCSGEPSDTHVSLSLYILDATTKKYINSIQEYSQKDRTVVRLIDHYTIVRDYTN